ncbi:MAG TPA: nucleotide exchange factor GrpE [Verrucomicrobiales bacterium]|jgi:molecular chaperone GrpE|nr:nucleotide exchange factor GrpE [Verrucomicrobiales bacterium]
MSSAMQKPNEENAQNTDELIAEENEATSAEDTPQEEVTEDSDAQEESEEEVDPWEALEMEVAKWKDQAIRSAAELDNYRKRMAREKLDAVRYGNQSLLEELLPVLDNFDMGMQAAAQEEGSMLYMGMNMVQKQLGEFLSSQNVEEITATAGGEFDPNLHEALSQEPSDKIEAGNIVRVMRKGYRIGERLLRPANVVVAASAEESESSESE